MTWLRTVFGSNNFGYNQSAEIYHIQFYFSSSQATPHDIIYLLFIDCTHILYHFYLFSEFHGVQNKTLVFLVRILFALQDECYIYAKITTVSCVFVAFIIIIVVVMLLPSGYKNQFVICSSYKVLKHSNCVIVAYYQIVLFNFGQARICSQG